MTFLKDFEYGTQGGHWGRFSFWVRKLLEYWLIYHLPLAACDSQGSQPRPSPAVAISKTGPEPLNLAWVAQWSWPHWWRCEWAVPERVRVGELATHPSSAKWWGGEDQGTMPPHCPVSCGGRGNWPLPLTSCNTWESGSCPSPGQHSKVEQGYVGWEWGGRGDNCPVSGLYHFKNLENIPSFLRVTFIPIEKIILPDL